jgi:hypothetical protein
MPFVEKADSGALEFIVFAVYATVMYWSVIYILYIIDTEKE